MALPVGQLPPALSELPLVKPTGPHGAAGPASEGGVVSFADKLREVATKVNEVPANAEKVAEAYADGRQNDLHGTMISMAQADISLRLVSNVRNRVIEAYREVMRMGA